MAGDPFEGMAVPLPADATPESIANAGASCRCAHRRDLHDPGAGCRVELPPFLEEELPAWRCPCVRFAYSPPGPWLWHPSTQSWAARGPRTAEPAA